MSASPQMASGSHSDRSPDRTSGWMRTVAAVTGVLIGTLALVGAGYASVRFGDDLPWLAPEGTAGTAWGYALLTLSLVGLLIGLVTAPRLPRKVWPAALVTAAVAVALLVPAPVIDCGNNITGSTCAGTFTY